MVPRFVVLTLLLTTDSATSTAAQLKVENQPERHRFPWSSFQSLVQFAFETVGFVGFDVVAAGAVRVIVHFPRLISVNKERELRVKTGRFNQIIQFIQTTADLWWGGNITDVQRICLTFLFIRFFGPISCAIANAVHASSPVGQLQINQNTMIERIW